MEKMLLNLEDPRVKALIEHLFAAQGGRGNDASKEEEKIDKGKRANESKEEEIIAEADVSHSGSSVMSWSDQTDEDIPLDANGKDANSSAGSASDKKEEGVGAAVLPAKPSYRDKLKVNMQPVEMRVGEDPGGFFAKWVRTPQVGALRKKLRDWGIKIDKGHYESLALTTYTAGTVPSQFLDGKNRLKVLANVGDRALSLLFADSCYGDGRPISEVSSEIARLFSHTNLSAVSVNCGLASFVSFPTGLDLKNSRPAGESFEAMVGVIYRSGGIEDVKKLMKCLGFLE